MITTRPFIAPRVDPYLHRQGFNENFVDYEELKAILIAKQCVLTKKIINNVLEELRYIMAFWKKIRFRLQPWLNTYNALLHNQSHIGMHYQLKKKKHSVLTWAKDLNL